MTVDPHNLPHPSPEIAERADMAMNRLCKWHTVFAGWQLGTQLDTDPTAQAVRDHRDMSMLSRAECSALVLLLIDKGVFTADEWYDQVADECEALCRVYEDRFPGFRATDEGLIMSMPQAAETMEGWPR